MCRSGAISVFDGRSPYNQHEDIIVNGMTEPRDMAACSDYHCLYVSDCNSWYVGLRCRLQLLLYIVLRHKYGKKTETRAIFSQQSTIGLAGGYIFSPIHENL